MLVELVQIRRDSNGKYGLKKIFVNPKYIVYLSEDSDLKNLLSEGALNLDIVKGATFTRVTLNENGNSSELTVVGSPSLIESKIFTKKEELY